MDLVEQWIEEQNSDKYYKRITTKKKIVTFFKAQKIIDKEWRTRE